MVKFGIFYGLICLDKTLWKWGVLEIKSQEILFYVGFKIIIC